MMAKGTASLDDAGAQAAAPVPAAAAVHKPAGGDMGVLKNNYVRPEGQNVGNYLTDRPSSRVLAPPGGGSSISLG